MAEVEQKDSGGKKKGKHSRRLHTHGRHEHVASYFLYALYLYEQTSDDGNQHAVKR